MNSACMNILNDVIPGNNEPIFRTLLIVTNQMSLKRCLNEDVPTENVIHMTEGLQVNTF